MNAKRFVKPKKKKGKRRRKEKTKLQGKKTSKSVLIVDF